jgi:hypothetical protein
MLESKKNRSISRRDLVKVASAGVGTIALGGIGAQPATAAETVPARWDVEADVVVIGSGARALLQR